MPAYDDVSTLRETDEVGSGATDRPLRLEVVYSPDPKVLGAACMLERGSVLLLGRSVAEGLRTADSKVSRLHLRIVWDRVLGGFRYGDAETANGTFVNGSPASTGLLLPGDVVRIGDTLLVCVERDLTAELRARVPRAGQSMLPVLIRGETGSGKELVARSIHEASGRAGAFIPVNCAALPPDLAATELFGHTRSAFSGAGAARVGLFRSADGGTLLLDEIGDLPLELQGHLLRALQEQSIRPVGADREVVIQTRVIAATHVNLEETVRQGRFRHDLYARLAQILIDVPPLRARRSELLRMAHDFAPQLTLDANAAEALLLWNWPGNVRELRALVEAHATMSTDTVVRANHLADRLPSVARVIGRRSDQTKGVPNALDRRALLSELLQKHQGNISDVARDLGKSRAQIYRWLRAFGLSKGHFR
jgi:DNA-binding NtrC family response regulator